MSERVSERVSERESERVRGSEREASESHLNLAAAAAGDAPEQRDQPVALLHVLRERRGARVSLLQSVRACVSERVSERVGE